MVDNNQQQEKPQDFELMELLFSKVDSSTSDAADSLDKSFEARYQSLVDQIQSYLHSSEKPGFFPHRFLGSFSSVLDTKLNDKLGIKKLHFRFEGSRTLKVVAETETKTHVFIFTEEIEAQHSHSPQTRTKNFEFTTGEWKGVMGRDYTPLDERKCQIDVIKILKDKYELVKSKPKSDKDVKSKKLYLYVKKDGVLEYVAKDIHGGTKAIQINRDELKGNNAFKDKFFDEIKQFLRSGKDLSDDVRKELSRITSAKGYTLKSDGEDEKINIKVESKKKIVDQPIEPTVKFQEVTKKMGKSIYLEDYIEKLVNSDTRQVKENLEDILNYIKKVHTNLDLQDSVYGNRAREADQHGFVAGVFDNFRYRDNTKLYLEQFAGGGYADIVLLVRGPNRAVDSVPILIELKAGTEGQVNPSDALRQAEDYIKGFRPNKMRVLTNAENAIAVGLNLDNAEPFKTEVKPIKQPPAPLMEEFIELVGEWDNQSISEEVFKRKVKDLLSSEYHTFPASKETKDHYYFSRDILGQSILINKIGQDQGNVKKYIYSYNEYPLNWPQGTEYTLSKSPVTTLIFVQGNEGQEKTAFIFHIRESNTKEFYADKKIPVLDIPGIGRVKNVIEIKMSLKKYETGLSFEELFEIKQISKYTPSGNDQQFTGNFLKILNSDELKAKFDQAITSQHASDGEVSLQAYKVLLTEVADTIYPVKDLITNEARLQAILNGLFSSYSDLKLQETSAKTVIIPEFQVGAGGRVDMVIQGIGPSPQGTKEYTPIALEFKLIDKNLNQDQLKQEVDKLTKEQNIRYAKGAALKAITDSDKMFFMGVVVNVRAEDRNHLILTSDEFVPALVVHSSIDIVKRKHLEEIQEVTQRLKNIGIQQEYLGTLEYATEKKDYRYWLQQHDIADIARIEYGYGADTLFEVVGSPEHIANQLQQFQNSVTTRGEKRPLTLIVNLNNNHWVTLVISSQNGQYDGFYVDSLGRNVPDNIRQVLQEAQITVHDVSVTQQGDGHNCGLWALENARDINTALQEGRIDEIRTRLQVQQRDEDYFIRRREDISERLSIDSQRIDNLEVVLAETQQPRSRLDACVGRGSRSKRSTNNCLFSRDDVEKFSKGKVDENNVDKIIIDSERFLTYVKNSQDEGKNAQLVEFVGNKNIEGDYKYLVDKVIGDQGYERYIQNERIKDLRGDISQQDSGLTKNPKLKSRLMNAAGGIQLIRGIHGAIVSCKDGTATDCGLNLGGMVWSFASQPIENVMVKITPKVVASAGKVAGKIIPGVLGKQTRFGIRIAGAKFGGTIARSTAGALTGVFDIVDIGMSASNLVDCKKRENSDNPCGEKEIRDNIASIAFSSVSFVSGVALTALSMPGVGIAVGVALMIGNGIYSGVSNIIEYEKKYDTTHDENWRIFWHTFAFQPIPEDVQHLAARKEVVNSLTKAAWQALNNSTNSIVAYGIGLGKVSDNTLCPDYAKILMNRAERANTRSLSRVIPYSIEGARRICLPQVTGQDYEKPGKEKSFDFASYYCENSMVISHDRRVNMGQDGKTIIYDLSNINSGTIIGHNGWNNNFFIGSGTAAITGGNNVANRFIINNVDFSGKIIGRSDAINILDLSQLEKVKITGMINYRFDPSTHGKLQVKINNRLLIDDYVSNNLFNYRYIGRQNKVNNILCIGYSEHFTENDSRDVIIDSGGSHKNERDVIENCKKVIISPYTTVKGRESNYTFYVKTAGYEGRDLYSEIDVEGTGSVIFPEIDLLRDCDKITYSKKSNILSLKINFGQNNQFTLDIKNYVEQSSNKPHFVLIDKNGSNIIPKIEKSDLPTIEIKSFELHSEHSLNNFDDVESHYKKILNNSKDYKVFSVIRRKTESQDNNIVPHMVFGSLGDDVINFDQGTMFARGGEGNDVYIIGNGREVKIDNNSDDKKADTLFIPEVEKDFSIQQCDLHLNYNNASIKVKNYFQDLNYRHLIIMNKKGETFIPNIQSISCSPSSSGNGKLVPFLQATQTQNMFLLPKDFEGDHVVIDSRLEDIEKYKDKDDLLLVREDENPFIVRIEGFYTDQDKWKNLSYSLWNNNDLLPSPGLLENVDNLIEYKDKLRGDYERIVKEYVEDFSDSTSIIQHNQKLEKNVSIPVEQDEEHIGVMVLKNITPDQVEVSSNGTDLVFRDKRSNHTISIKGWGDNESYRIFILEFDLGLEPIKILRLNKFSLSEAGKIQDLIEKASDNYKNRTKYTSKVETDFKCLVSAAGFVNENPAYQCLGFSSLEDQVSFTENSCSLEQLSEFRDKLNDTQVSALSRALQNNLLLNAYDQDVIEQCSKLMATEESDQKSKISSMVKSIVKKDLKNSILNNSPLATSTTNAICNLNKKLCGEAMKEAVNDVYEKVDKKKMLRLMHDCSDITQSVQGYVGVFDAMQKKNDLNSNAVFKLSYYIKEIMEKDGCRSLHSEERSSLEEIRNKLPESVKNVVFSSQVCIKSVKFNEYLHASDWKYASLESDNRQIFTWILRTKGPQSEWKVDPYMGNFRIINVHFNESLYATTESLNYIHPTSGDKRRRRVFAQAIGSGGAQSAWEIEAYGDNIYIKNVKFNEYLYSALYDLAYSQDERSVFTWDEQTRDPQCVWKIEDCGSAYEGCNVQEKVSLASDSFKTVGVQDKLNDTQILELSKSLQNISSLSEHDRSTVDQYLRLKLQGSQQVVGKVSSVVKNIEELVFDSESRSDLGGCTNDRGEGNTNSCPAFIRDVYKKLHTNERKNISVDEKDVITSGYETLDIEHLPAPEVVINDDVNGKKSLRRTLDLHYLVEQVGRGLSIKPMPMVVKDKNDLLIKLSISATGLQQDVITIRLKKALVNRWYKKLQIIFDSAPMEIDDSLGLKSSFFISDEKTTVVRPQDIEENNKLIISKRAGQYTYLHDKYDVIVTNAFNPDIEASELFIIYFRDFYKEPKMKTLSIKFTDKEILLSNEIDKIYNSDIIDKLSDVSSIINSKESSVPLEVPDSGDINVPGELGRTSLHLASKAGERDKVKLLLDRGANIEAKDEYGYTPIFLATQSGKWSVVELLFDRGANIDAQDKEGKTLLHFAIRENNLDMIQFLLNRGAGIDIQDKLAWTPILYAAQLGKWDVVKLLIDNGAKFNNETTIQGTPLHFAVQESNLDMIRFLLDKGADIESQDKDNRKPLHLAVGTNRLNVVKLLLDRGANVNVTDMYNKTPLDLATEEDMIELLKKAQLDQRLLINARDGNLNGVKDLIDQDANLETKDNNGNTPLHNTCSNGHLEVVKYFLEKKASLEAKNKDGKTPLDLAVQKGYTPIVQAIGGLNEKLLSAVKNGDLNEVKALVSQGASLEAKDNSGNTPLHNACSSGHVKVVEYLIKEGAILKPRNKDGETPLHVAAQHDGTLEVIELILKGDPNGISDVTNDGRTPLHLAIQENKINTVELLLKKGASFTVKDKNGKTPLDLAKQEDYTDIVERIERIQSDLDKELLTAVQSGNSNEVNNLVSRNASVNTRDIYSWTPLHRASYKGYSEIARFLIEKGADINAADKGPDGKKPIHVAAENGSKDIVELLLSKGVGVDDTDNQGYTSLYYAVLRGRLEVADLLISKKANVNSTIKGTDGKKPIHVAAENGSKDIVELLLSKGVGVDDTDNQGYTSLYYAVLRGRLEVADLLISKKANVNSTIKGTDGKTLLHLVVEEGDMGMLEIFFGEGANLEVKDTYGWTPICFAAIYNKLNVVEFLFNEGAKINTIDKYNNTLLHIAARYSSALKIVEFFLDKNANAISSVNNIGRTPLHGAVEGNKLNTVKFLLGRGADIEIQDTFGETPLVMAIRAGYTNIVEALQHVLDKQLLTAVKGDDLDKARGLIARGANINTKDENGDTLLYFFAGLGDLDRTKFLLENSASTEVKNEKYDQTPLHTAIQNSKLNVVKLLLSFNANVNAIDSFRWTPPHYAADVGNLDIMKVLADAHANLSATGDYGKTPLDVAKDKGHNKIVEYLEEKLREERGGRKRRYLLSESLDSSGQPEIAASSGTRPYSWLNYLPGLVKSFIGELLSSKSEGTTSSVSQVDGQFAKASISNSSLTGTTLPSDDTDKRQENGGFFRDNIDYVNANIKQMRERQTPVKFKPSGGNTILEMGDHYLSQVDFNGTIALFDLLIRRVTGQKYISTADQSISPLEAQGYALNITKGFEKIVEQAGLKSGVSMHRLNIDYMGMQKEVTKKIMGGKFDEISGIVKSQIEKACPGGEAGCPGKLSPKKFDKFIAQFSKGLLNQSIHQMLHNENNSLKMDNIKEPQSSGLSGPRTRLNDVLIASNTRELVAGRR